MQKNLLANKLKIRPDSDWPRAIKLNLLLYKVVKCQLYKIAKTVSDLLLDLVAKCQAIIISDFII